MFADILTNVFSSQIGNGGFDASCLGKGRATHCCPSLFRIIASLDSCLRHARHKSLSSRVLVEFWNALVSAIRPAASVPRSTHSNKWSSPTRKRKMSFFLRRHLKRFQISRRFVAACRLWSICAGRRYVAARGSFRASSSAVCM